MFTAAALISSPPLLIPELAGAAAVETQDLRRASVDVAGQLADSARRWTIVGVGATEAEYPPDTVGTFAGFGVDVRAALRTDVHGPADPTLPLPLLVGGWLRGTVAGQWPLGRRPLVGEVVADGIVLAPDTSPVYCAQVGAQLCARLDAEEQSHGVLVVTDGANTLTAKAPGAFDDRAPDVQRDLDAALSEGDVDHLASLDPVVCAELGIAGRPAWQVLAGLFGGPPRHCSTNYQGAPYGVGYHVGLWLP